MINGLFWMFGVIFGVYENCRSAGLPSRKQIPVFISPPIPRQKPFLMERFRFFSPIRIYSNKTRPLWKSTIRIKSVAWFSCKLKTPKRICLAIDISLGTISLGKKWGPFFFVLTFAQEIKYSGFLDMSAYQTLSINYCSNRDYYLVLITKQDMPVNIVSNSIRRLDMLISCF